MLIDILFQILRSVVIGGVLDFTVLKSLFVGIYSSSM